MNILILLFRKVTPLCLILVALGSLVLCQQTQAAKGGPNTPDPPGPLPVSNTADGQNALLNITGGGIHNSAFGFDALVSQTDADFCTAVGSVALLLNNASENTAVGCAALFTNSTGTRNNGFGTFTLFSNTEGSDNTAVGDSALASNATGNRHTAVGSGALLNCVAAPDFEGNTAVGAEALRDDTTGNFNTAMGGSALKLNTIGTVNTAIGLDALVSNTEGSSNTAIGGNTLFNNTTGTQNTATGIFALFSNETGNTNTAVGLNALNMNIAGSSNTAVGVNALISSTGDGNTALGSGAGGSVATADNVICIGNTGADVSNTAWIGNVFGVTTVSGTTAPVIVSDGGQLGTLPSSERFKKDIATMEKGSEAILALRPVTFHYKTDTKGVPQFGLIAEEVARVNPALVLPDKQGKPYTVRYDAVNAMLLNEFLKEHRKVEQLEKQVQKLAAGLQKVSAQLELTKSEPQTVLNNQ